MGSEISFYFSIFLRRFHYFALVSIVVGAAGVATALLLPTRYYTDALLLIEPPQIPQDLAQSTYRINPLEQLQILQQEVLTRANLIEIANENRVFGEARMHPDDVADAMRSATSFRISVGRDEASLFTIGFEADNPATAAGVVNDLVTRVEEISSQGRKGAAEDTKEYFDREVARLGADLAAKSAAILEFKNANINALPDNLNYQMGRRDDIRARIADIDRRIVEREQQRARLILVFEATGGAGTGNRIALSPEQRELQDLRAQLASAITIYSEDSPRLRSLRSRVERLESLVASTSTGDDGATTAVTMLDVELDQIDNQMAQLREEQVELLAEVERLEVNIEATPTNAIALETLERDYQNIQNQYNQTIERAAVAATGERIELLSKGERISVINPPVVPRDPSSPNRPLIAIGGVLAGMAMGLAAIVGLELLNRSIRRPVDLSRALGIVPIATLPVLRTPGEIFRRRTIMAGVIMSSTAGIVAGIVFLHTQVMPLDLMVDLAVQQLGG